MTGRMTGLPAFATPTGYAPAPSGTYEACRGCGEPISERYADETDGYCPDCAEYDAMYEADEAEPNTDTCDGCERPEHRCDCDTGDLLPSHAPGLALRLPGDGVAR